MLEIKIEIEEYPVVKTTTIDTDEGFVDEQIVDLTEFIGNQREMILLFEDLFNIATKKLIDNKLNIYKEIRNVYDTDHFNVVN